MNPIVVLKGITESFVVENIASTITLPTTPTIYLRQNSAALLSFVTIVNGQSSADVTINTTGVTAGSYTLTLESYDGSSGSSMATLKTDKVTIEVKFQKSLASFASVLKAQTIVSG
jgi:hypothetical protein